MRNRISYIATFLVAAAALTASCVKDVNPSGQGETPDGPKSDREMFFSLNLGIKDAGLGKTRADDGMPLPSENWVQAVRMVLYEGMQTVDEDGNTIPDPEAKVLYAFDYYIRSFSEGYEYPIEGYEPWDENDGIWYESKYGWDQQLAPYPGSPVNSGETTDKFVTYARGVEDRDYYMLILVNVPGREIINTRNPEPDDDPLIIQITRPGRQLKEFLAPVMMNRQTLYHTQNTIIEDRRFFMTNANGLVFVPSEKLGNSEADAHAHPIETEVERAVAKVFVTKNADLIPPSTPNAAVGDIRFDIVNTNKWTYWMRKQTRLITEAGTPGTYEGAAQPISDRLQVYAEDPNFKGFKDLSSSKRGEYFDLLTDLYPGGYHDGYLGSFGRWDVYEKDVDRNSIGYTYILENTMAADEQTEDMIPTIYFAAPYTPDVNRFPLAEYQDMPGTSYFMFNGVAITISEMQGYAANPATIIDSELTGLAAAISDLENDEGMGIRIADIYNYSPPFKAYGINFYQYGVNYYKAPIVNYIFSGTPADPAYGKYGVVRNGMYMVNVTDVSGPGSPTLTDPAYISAEVSIVKWYQRSQNSDIGSEVGELNPDPAVTYKYYYEDFKPGYPYYGWHFVEFRTYSDRIPATEPIPQGTGILDRYKGDIPVAGSFNSGVAYGDEWFSTPAPGTVSSDENENIVYIVYSQPKGALKVYLLEWDSDPEVNLCQIIYSSEYLTEEYAIGTVVTKDTQSSYLGASYANNLYDYHTDTEYVFHSIDPASTTIDGTEQSIMVYYVKQEATVNVYYKDFSTGENIYTHGSNATLKFAEGTVVDADTDGVVLQQGLGIQYYYFFYDCVPSQVVASNDTPQDITLRYVKMEENEGAVAFVYWNMDTDAQFAGDEYNQVAVYDTPKTVSYTDAPLGVAPIQVGADTYEFDHAEHETVNVSASAIKVIKLYYRK